MTTYKNNHGIIAFTHEGKDYISHEGDEMLFPETDYIKSLEYRGYISKVEKSKKLKDE
jgi:hypothetical protein